MNPLHAEIASLRRENDELRAEITVLRAELAPIPSLVINGVKLTPSETTLLSALIRGRVVPLARLVRILYDSEPPLCADANARVFMLRLRRKLKALGVSILNLRHQGYFIADDHKAVLAAATGEPRS